MAAPGSRAPAQLRAAGAPAGAGTAGHGPRARALVRHQPGLHAVQRRRGKQPLPDALLPGGFEGVHLVRPATLAHADGAIPGLGELLRLGGVGRWGPGRGAEGGAPSTVLAQCAARRSHGWSLRGLGQDTPHGRTHPETTVLAERVLRGLCGELSRTGALLPGPGRLDGPENAVLYVVFWPHNRSGVPADHWCTLCRLLAFAA
mmetsp:Transcript_38179/g.106347  ORF Transcript_38179/g.106347 Transcript_38179/m.106347 type:complete len:203 (+) Transcript_38179:791-1399(+)